MVWLALAGAIVFEVSATISLRMATTGPSPRRIWYLPVGVGYVVAFALLSATLALGLPLGIAYGVWAAVGVALTAILGRVLFREPLTAVMVLGILLIGAGVVLVELGSLH
ncbi:DMT family transporter [Leifsonia sp. NPDC058194]|uniref:DMT family transporter n=1 Tax=Leifsonia sp. NPDC058194 TaxID=3346374 RepID=UPI0036DE873E